MRTAHTLPYGGGCDRDSSRLRPPGQRHPLHRDAPGQRPESPRQRSPRQRPPGQRTPPWTESPREPPDRDPLDRHPQTETPLGRDPPGQRPESPGQRPPDRDPLDRDPSPQDRDRDPRGQTDTCETIAFANSVLAGGKNSGKLEGIASLEEASLCDTNRLPTGYPTIQYLELYFYV